MTDTHTHLYFTDLPDWPDTLEVVDRAIRAGVTRLVFPNVDLASVGPLVELASKRPGNIRTAIGLHPTEVKEDWGAVLDRMEVLLHERSWSAIGEVGMDLYWDKTMRSEQVAAFRRQLLWAKETGLPVIIHCREGLDDTLAVIADLGMGSHPMIFHSFTGTPVDVRRIREVCDPMFGINGVVTFKNAASLREALPEIGIDRIVLETDAPYLAPVPHRGKTNESSYIPEVCRKVAEVLNLTPEEVEKATDANADKIFNF